MYFDEYGRDQEAVIVFLHGANFVHTFGRQYTLAKQYHIYVPHIMGFGKEAHQIFETEKAAEQLAEWISGIGKKVTLVGFSLGAQLAYKLVCEREDLFERAVIISPWLLKEGTDLAVILQQNEKQLTTLKKKGMCNFIGRMNGLPKQQRKEFVEQMQLVSPETIRNSVDNGIALTEQFSAVSIPIIALAGEKEQHGVLDTVKQMSALNPNCRYEIWEKAAHNIPPVFAKRLNELICSFVETQ